MRASTAELLAIVGITLAVSAAMVAVLWVSVIPSGLGLSELSAVFAVVVMISLGASLGFYLAFKRRVVKQARLERMAASISRGLPMNVKSEKRHRVLTSNRIAVI